MISRLRFLKPAVAISLAALMWLAAGVAAQQPATIATTQLPSVMAGRFVRIKIQAKGGIAPFGWKIVGGSLPPGLKLSATSGTIFGIPATPGSYQLQVQMTDSSGPPLQVQREFTLVVTAALGIEWKRSPAVNGQKLEGSVVVTNYTQQNFTLTVVIVAVNEIGRATALGYQEFQLKTGGTQVIPFGAEPGPGKYVVHADAVAEVAAADTIYRARKQTTQPLVIADLE